MKKHNLRGAVVAGAAAAALLLTSCGFGGGSTSGAASGSAGASAGAVTTLDMMVPSYSRRHQGAVGKSHQGLRGSQHRRQGLGGDFDLVDYVYGRLAILADYEAVLGDELQLFDPNQASYTLEVSVSARLRGTELAGVLHHVSRHLSDRRTARRWPTTRSSFVF